MVVYIVINEYDDLIENVYAVKEKAEDFIAQETERYDGFYTFHIDEYTVV